MIQYLKTGIGLKERVYWKLILKKRILKAFKHGILKSNEI